MLYLIGLGLNEKAITQEALECLEKCAAIYLESYTVDFPYDILALEKELGKKIIKLGRKEVESDFLMREAKKKEIALLVYGSALFATTHFSLIDELRKNKVKIKIVYNASVFDAIGETGLHLYKFGKISSMPLWDSEKNYIPDSFIDNVKENLGIRAHSLILVDIGLSFEKSLNQLEIACKNKKLEINRIMVCSRLGTKESRILFGSVEELKKTSIKQPFCFIIPSSELHFLEEEALARYKKI